MSSFKSPKFVLVGGTGPLPKFVHQKLQSKRINPRVYSLLGTNLDQLDPKHTKIDLQNFLQELQQCVIDGYTNIVLVGAIDRKKLILQSKIDESTNDLISGGDDTVLKRFLSLIEQLGFTIWGIGDLLEELIQHDGYLTKTKPNTADIQDSIRGEKILHAMGAADIGQATIIRDKLCLGVETIFGTDRMLQSLLDEFSHSRLWDTQGGLLFKGSKPNQDLRVDLPTIGLTTMKLVHQLQLRGIVIESNKTVILDKQEVIEFANSQGLFLWSKVYNEINR